MELETNEIKIHAHRENMDVLQISPATTNGGSIFIYMQK